MRRAGGERRTNNPTLHTPTRPSRPLPLTPPRPQLIDTLHIHRSPHFLIGSDPDLADVVAEHASVSGQHAVIQYRQVPYSGPREGMAGVLVCKPYVIDLDSRNGTQLNGVRLEPKRYYEMRKGDMLLFGASTREYVLMKA